LVETFVTRSCAIAALCLLLAACAAPAPERTGFLRAWASPEAPAGALAEVVLDDIPAGYAIERVALIDSGGGRHEAERLIPSRHQSGATAPGAGIGIAVTGGSSSGIKPALSLGIGTGFREETRSGKRLRARIPLPDPAAFHDHPARWRLEVGYRDVTGSLRNLVLPVAGMGK
jgi:hypothetical protein